MMMIDMMIIRNIVLKMVGNMFFFEFDFCGDFDKKCYVCLFYFVSFWVKFILLGY